jgi:RHS repeat-associated protein
LEYNSFGKIISATKNDSSLQFAYTGKLTDKEIDLQWNINRWYDAKIGCWIAKDPIGFEGKDKNLYRYAINSPLINIDPSGKVYFRRS